jgi:hypothetical protein
VSAAACIRSSAPASSQPAPPLRDVIGTAPVLSRPTWQWASTSPGISQAPVASLGGGDRLGMDHAVDQPEILWLGGRRT